MNNPAKANILDKATSDEISAAWIDLWEDRAIRCAILTGAGDRHFCGGHNLAPRKNITEEEREYLRTQRILWPLAGTVHGQKTGVDGRMGDHYPRVWKPVIAAVNGWAAGAGLYILLSSTDIRIASAEHARFKFALTTQGWRGHGPGASLLIKQLRYIDAVRMLLTDDPVDAAEALRIGLINEVVPHAELMERAEKIARHIVKMPPVTLRMMKEFVVRFGDLPTDQAWHVQNLINNLLIQVTTDGEEGRQAFNDKRPPNFTGALRRRGEAWEEPSEEDAERRQRIGEAEPVHQAEPKSDGETVPRPTLAAHVLDRHPDDRQRDQRLDHRRRRVHQAEHRHRQGDAVRQGEHRGDAEHPPEIRGTDQQCEQEQQMVVSGQDVLDAETDKAG